MFALSTINGFQYYKLSLTIIGIIAVCVLMMVFIPESPRWLLVKGRKASAIVVLKHLRGPDSSIETEVQAIEADIENSPKLKLLKQISELFHNRLVCSHVFAVVVVMFLQQMSGLNAASAYATSIFEEAGVANPSQTASYAVGVVSIVFTLVAIVIVDRIGRKVLLIVSGVGLVVATVMLGTHFYVTRPSLCANQTNLTLNSKEVGCSNTTYLVMLCENQTLSSEAVMCDFPIATLCENLTNEDDCGSTTYLATLCENQTLSSEAVVCDFPIATLCENPTITRPCNSHLAPVAITSLMLFFAAFSIGWGPVPWILIGELIPLHVRGFGNTLATFTNWGSAAIVLGFYFSYSEFVNLWFAWWTFSVINIIGVLFVAFFVPETKGKTLEDISKRKNLEEKFEDLNLEEISKDKSLEEVSKRRSQEEISEEIGLEEASEKKRRQEIARDLSWEDILKEKSWGKISRV